VSQNIYRVHQLGNRLLPSWKVDQEPEGQKADESTKMKALLFTLIESSLLLDYFSSLNFWLGKYLV
jgi:hypothetical protein